MTRAQKIHTLKVIKESMNSPIVFLEAIQGEKVYLTSNRFEISQLIRMLFFKDAIIFENVSKQTTIKNWISIP